MADGPFEDNEGIGSHFDRKSLQGDTMAKRVASMKVDVHVALIHLARKVAALSPKIVFGFGQGAVIVAAYSKPQALEAAAAS